MNFKSIRMSAVIFALLSLVFIGACDDDDPATNTYTATQSPGDVWSWTVTPSTFEGTNETAGFTYSGTSETLPNLFRKFTVTASTDPGVPLDGTAIAYALEVPGTALIVKPAGADSKVIVGVGQGTCPTADDTYNWVTIPRTGWSVLTDEAYGTAVSTVSGSTVSFTVSSFLLDSSPASSNPASTTCSSGVMTEAGSDLTIGIAPSGTFVGDNGAGEGGFIGVAAPAVDISFSDITAEGLEFRGVLFKNDDAGEDTQPVWARRSSAGVMSGGDYTDFEGNTENSEAVSIAFTGQSAPGLLQATLTDPGGTSTFVFVVNQVGSGYVLYGISQDSGGGTTPYNVLLVSQ